MIQLTPGGKRDLTIEKKKRQKDIQGSKDCEKEEMVKDSKLQNQPRGARRKTEDARPNVTTTENLRETFAWGKKFLEK